jgi:hypothetical protein
VIFFSINFFASFMRCKMQCISESLVCGVLSSPWQPASANKSTHL